MDLVYPGQLPDVNDAEGVEFEVSADGKVVYFHINGITAVRCVNPKRIIITDNRV